MLFIIMYKNVKNPYVYYYSNENLKEYNLISWAFYRIKFCIFFEVFRRYYSKRFLRLLSDWLKEKMLQAYFNKVLKEEISPGLISAVSPAKQPKQLLQQNLPEPLKLLGQKAIQYPQRNRFQLPVDENVTLMRLHPILGTTSLPHS